MPFCSPKRASGAAEGPDSALLPAKRPKTPKKTVSFRCVEISALGILKKVHSAPARPESLKQLSTVVEFLNSDSIDAVECLAGLVSTHDPDQLAAAHAALKPDHQASVIALLDPGSELLSYTGCRWAHKLSQTREGLHLLLQHADIGHIVQHAMQDCYHVSVAAGILYNITHHEAVCNAAIPHAGQLLAAASAAASRQSQWVAGMLLAAVAAVANSSEEGKQALVPHMDKVLTVLTEQLQSGNAGGKAQVRLPKPIPPKVEPPSILESVCSLLSTMVKYLDAWTLGQAVTQLASLAGQVESKADQSKSEVKAGLNTLSLLVKSPGYGAAAACTVPFTMQCVLQALSRMGGEVWVQETLLELINLLVQEACKRQQPPSCMQQMVQGLNNPAINHWLAAEWFLAPLSTTLAGLLALAPATPALEKAIQNPVIDQHNRLYVANLLERIAAAAQPAEAAGV